jgi:hypothetical protein
MSYHTHTHLSYNEFLDYAERLIDDMTSTELEIELIRRFKLVAANSELVEACSEATPDEVSTALQFHDENRDIIGELDQAGITCLDDLEKFLEEKQELKERLAVYESAINRIKTIIEEEK